MAKYTDKIILIDADVIIHFLKGGQIYQLGKIFKYKIKILDIVYKELEKNRGKKAEVDNLINQKILEIEDFPSENGEIKKEYYYVKNKLFKGDGESACLAYARFSKNIIASSNISDIKGYCNLHSVEYLTTMDFLCEALEIGLFNLNICNDFIENVKSQGSRLPVNRMEEYACRDLKSI